MQQNRVAIRLTAMTGSVILLVEKQLSTLSLHSTYNETVVVRWWAREQLCPTTSGQQCGSPLLCLVARTTFLVPVMLVTSTDLIANLT